MTRMVAALFVETNGVYYGLESISPWDVHRDARRYSGPWPVVCHPPCERWGRYWGGGPMLHGTPKQKKLGDDDGCFENALHAVNTWGGVLEHPEASHAFARFGLTRPPRFGGWVASGSRGFTCCVEQGHYGHPARKATWLYYVGREPPFDLAWGPSSGRERLEPGFHSREERAAASYKQREVWRLRKHEMVGTPPAFRDVLVSLALHSDGRWARRAA
jgi:hypothetical protein